MSEVGPNGAAKVTAQCQAPVLHANARYKSVEMHPVVTEERKDPWGAGYPTPVVSTKLEKAGKVGRKCSRHSVPVRAATPERW